MCDYAAEKYDCYTVFVPMQLAKDEPISRSIANRMETASSLLNIRMGVSDVISVMAAADVCIGMRLHSLIYSAIGNVPVVGISYDPKIKSFMDYMNQNLCIDITQMNGDMCCKALDELFGSYDRIKSELSAGYKEFKTKAKENGRIAMELYEKGCVELEQ